MHITSRHGLISLNSQIESISINANSLSNDINYIGNSKNISPNKNMKRNYIYSPFNNTDLLIYDTLSKFIFKKNDTEIIFKNKVQFDNFCKQIESEKWIITEFVKKKLPNLSEKHVDSLVNNFCEKYTYNNPKYSFDEINNPSPNIYVIGHGSPGVDTISPTPTSNMKKEIFDFELVTHLLKAQLPLDAKIKLDFCWSAASKSSSSAKADEINELFFTSKLEQVVGDPKESFMGTFFQELIERVPSFSGVVQGYQGVVLADVKDGVLCKSKTLGTHFAVAMPSSDNTNEIFIRKSHARVTFSNKNLSSF
ncbi:hypothetical protein [Vibrio sp. TBV020]|uniref:hypothetical protein n=1 Tax=Vibrio sp. TBV020 TaxID=3137398 RepID=UPI0038CD2ADC